jgi:hypothetical protein
MIAQRAITPHYLPAPAGLDLLEEVILELRTDLQRYADKDNAQQWVLDKGNERILKLTQCLNALLPLRRPDTWQEIEQTISQLEARDNQLSGVTIRLQTRLNGNGFYGFINKALDDGAEGI